MNQEILVLAEPAVSASLSVSLSVAGLPDSPAAARIREAAFASPQDFVYDPHGERLALACGFDGHPRLAAVLGDGAQLVGGRLGRDAAGRLATSEWSGHYGAGWDEGLRQRFADFMRRCALPVRHRPWHTEQTAHEVG